METKQTNIFKALADFQQECPVIHKGTKGHNYSYADLPAIFDIINPLLKKHGLGFTQLMQGTSIQTILFHIKTGETIESKTEVPQVELRGMNAFQSAGSGITYYRRYALSSMLGIVTDKDTDASGEQKKASTLKSKPTLPEDRFNDALEEIKAGNYDKESLKNIFSLNAEQLKRLEE